MSTSLDAAGFAPIPWQSRVQPPNLSSFGSIATGRFNFRRPIGEADKSISELP
jgi:hypothetical protein